MMELFVKQGYNLSHSAKLKGDIFRLITPQLWVMIGPFSQSPASISNPDMNLRLNSMSMFNFLKLFTPLLLIFGNVDYFAEIIGYGCK
jgi:hypothetical protein